jgi:hypothetical protein
MLVASLTIFGLLPATAAFAQATATAELTGNQVVFPGDTTYSIKVTNTEPQIVGRTINAVSIQLPTAATNIVFRGAPPAAGNFTSVKVVKSGYTQIVTYKGGTIAPQGTQTFSIPVTVQRPARSDLRGDFVVQVSSDNNVSGKTATPASAGKLTAAVESLEILAGSLRPTAPVSGNKGVADRIGTAGQTITYSFDVKNYARETLSVTGALAASDTSDRPSAVAAKSVPGLDGLATFNVPVALGAALTQRTTNLTASAVAANADAAMRQDTFTVQVPVDLAFSNLQPPRVRSGFGSAREFNVAVDKTGGPRFTLNQSTLQFGGNTAALKGDAVEFAANAENRLLAYQIPEIAGVDGILSATISNVGQDENLANYNLNRSAGVITIDNIVPKLDILQPVLGNGGLDVDGDALSAVTEGTKITVSGKAIGNDLAPTTLKVTLTPDAGNAITVPVTTKTESDGISFTGSVTGATVTWHDSATQFVVSAQIADEATNVGSGQSSLTLIDQFKPVLDTKSGVVIATNRIRVDFDDQTGLRGACDPSSWRIDGTAGRVLDVRTGDGQLCSGSTQAAVANARRLSPDGVRVLTLNYTLGPDDTPTVTYTPGLSEAASRQLGIYIAKDGAANDAAEQTINTVTDLVPRIPDVTNLRRKDHATGARETAYFDTQELAYFTNVGGTDAIVASIGGVRKGYKIQVLDGSGGILKTENAVAPTTIDPNNPLATEWTQDVTIPIGTTDRAYARGIRLVSSVGKPGAQQLTTIVLDTLKPTIGQSTLSGPGEAHMRFAEKIVNANLDRKEDWYVRWTMVTEGETRQVLTNVETFTKVNEDPFYLRRGTFVGIDENTFQGLDYLRQSEATPQYEDRAGNYMLDTVVSEP